MLAPSTSAPYTPYYCEENVWHLLHSLDRSRFPRSFALFISNPERHALLFQQKASRQGAEQAHYVLWDYHVVAVAVERVSEGPERVVVLDRDSRLGEVVELREYVADTFRPDLFKAGVLNPSLQSRFRVVPSENLLNNFASDRTPRPTSPPPPQYIHPIPPYPPLCGSHAAARGETHNLWTRFLEMRLPHERRRGRAEGEKASEEGEGFERVLSGVEELLTYPW
ncbi:hypothetical protein JCM10450v2_001610 [Rhodotorula kratochvilovae]